MVHISENELKTLNFLVRHFTEKYSINELAKKVGITPKGLHKLLKRLEKNNIVTPEKLANAVFYKINFSSDLARKSAELSLFEDIKLPYARVQAKDFDSLREFVLAAVLFGSVLEKGEKAGDIDVLLVFDKKNYLKVKKELEKIQSLKPKHIHLVMQTSQDLINNLKKQDNVLLEILRTGKILWGYEVIVGAIKEVVER
ncbi:winged helix-turn-helix transcriptional regulator [archaeon]|nr:winged helix-turn-helix transcriptional regulator [archaeon]